MMRYFGKPELAVEDQIRISIRLAELILNKCPNLQMGDPITLPQCMVTNGIVRMPENDEMGFIAKARSLITELPIIEAEFLSHIDSDFDNAKYLHFFVDGRKPALLENFYFDASRNKEYFVFRYALSS